MTSVEYEHVAEILRDLTGLVKGLSERLHELERAEARRLDRAAHLNLRLTGGGRSFDPYYERLCGR